MTKKTKKPGPSAARGGAQNRTIPPTTVLAERAKEVTRRLKSLYENADCALHHRSALELLIATILSAQCTDERVNKVTPALFQRFRTAADFKNAKPDDLESLIKSTGFFRNKAKNIIGAGRVICDRFDGQVPDTMEQLLELPGVARKTANVVLGTWFKKNEGFVVDTHIGRLSQRLGLSWRSRDSKDAVRIEQDLMEIVPQKDWTFLGHALISHGRAICTARKPKCEACILNDICPSAFHAVDETVTPADDSRMISKSGRGAKSQRRLAQSSGEIMKDRGRPDRASGKRSRR